MNAAVYVIGDIHGQRAMLEEALTRIDADGGAGAKVVFLGDLVDRGPDSRGVIDIIIEGIAQGRDWIVLKGNHDDYVSRFLDQGDAHASKGHPGLPWFDPRLGGDATMASYGVATADRKIADILEDACAAVPRAHREFIAGLPLWHEAGGLLFVHAGIRPGVPLVKQSTEDLMWIREPFLSWPERHPWLVVHGHTALDFPHHYGNRVNLDGGAGWGRPLFPAVFEGRECCLLSGGGRMRLPANPEV